MTLVLLAPPTSEPVSLAEAKAWLRLDTNDEDTVVQSLIVAARTVVETATGRALVTQRWRIALDAWPDAFAGAGLFGMATFPTLPLPLAPLVSIDAVRVYGSDDVPQQVAATTYRIAARFDEPHVVFTVAPPSPVRAMEGIEIDVTAGYGAPADVPPPMRTAILMIVARTFERRGDQDGTAADDPVGAVRSMLAPYRRARLA